MMKSVEELQTALEKVLDDVRRANEEQDISVWKSDKDAAKGTGLGTFYWNRIRHLVPHFVIPADEKHPQAIVYPKQAVKEWLNDHTETY